MALSSNVLSMFLFLGSFMFDVAYILSNVLIPENYMLYTIMVDDLLKILTLILGSHHVFVFFFHAIELPGIINV
jgi:hypothetical protein